MQIKFKHNTYNINVVIDKRLQNLCFITHVVIQL